MNNSSTPFPEHEPPIGATCNLVNHKRTKFIIKLSKFFMALAIIGFLFCISAHFIALFTGIYYVILIILVILSLGTLLLNSSFWNAFRIGSVSQALTTWIHEISPYVLIPTIICAGLSLLIIIINRNKHRTWKFLLITNIVVIVVAIVLLVFRLTVLMELLSQINDGLLIVYLS